MIGNNPVFTENIFLGLPGCVYPEGIGMFKTAKKRLKEKENFYSARCCRPSLKTTDKKYINTCHYSKILENSLLKQSSIQNMLKPKF